MELYAKLEGVMTKEAREGARGVAVVILQNNDATPPDPEVFRESGAADGAEDTLVRPAAVEGG